MVNVNLSIRTNDLEQALPLEGEQESISIEIEQVLPLEIEPSPIPRCPCSSRTWRKIGRIGTDISINLTPIALVITGAATKIFCLSLTGLVCSFLVCFDAAISSRSREANMNASDEESHRMEGR